MFTHFYKPGLRQSCCVIKINFADNIQVATMMHGMYVFVEKSHLKFHMLETVIVGHQRVGRLSM